MKTINYKAGDIVVLLYHDHRIVGDLVDIDGKLYYRPNGMRIINKDILEPIDECTILRATESEKKYFLTNK